jgi:hypothetical protein
MDLEDMSLRTQVIGRIDATRLLRSDPRHRSVRSFEPAP